MRSDYIKPSVYSRVFQFMQYENALALRLSLETGMRIGDVLSLQKNALEGRTVRFTAQKTGKPDKKTISADLAKRLKLIAGAEFIFTGRSGDKPRTRQAVWKDVKKAARHFAIQENLTCHSARKTYAVAEREEHGLAAVQKELQHDRVETTMLYAFSDLLTEKPKSTDAALIADEDDLQRFADELAARIVNSLKEFFKLNEIEKKEIKQRDENTCFFG